MVAVYVPWLRYQKHRNYQQAELTVLCRLGEEALFEDFAHPIIPVEVQGIGHIDCQNAWQNGHCLKRDDYVKLTNDLLRKRIGKANVITPLDMQVNWDPVPMTQHEFRKYGVQGIKVKGQIGIHARASSRHPERNWSGDNWTELMTQLDAECVVYFGKRGQALVSDGLDKIDKPLAEVMECMAECEVVIGPSSGPLPLANLCGTSVVWWSPNPKDVVRFSTAWNPFSIPNIRASESWSPDIDQILKAVESLRIPDESQPS